MIESLQSLRFVFMMMIFMSHFSYGSISAFDAGGDCGVAFFFVLSGFVCTMGYGEKISNGAFSHVSFLLRRLKKLYPLHLLCLAFVVMVSYAPMDQKLLADILLVQSWIPDASWYFSGNSVAWFLSSMMFCYVVFPWAYKNMSPVLTAVILATYTVVLIGVPHSRINAILYVFPPMRFVDFYLGMVTCEMFKHSKEHRSHSLTEILLVAVLVILLAVYPFADAKLRNAPMYWIVLLPMIWVFAQQKGFLSRWLATKPMVFLGSLTMPLFLTHQILIGILLRRLPEMPSAAMLAVCVFVALTVSWTVQMASHLFISDKIVWKKTRQDS